jgi:type I restriction enzyme M protein
MMENTTTDFQDIKDRCLSLIKIIQTEVGLDGLSVALYLFVSFVEKNVLEFNWGKDGVNSARLSKEASPTFHQIHKSFAHVLDRISLRTLQLSFEILDSIEPKRVEKYYSDIFDFLLYRINKGQGRFTGQFVLPNELSAFAANIPSLPENAKVYNPFAGTASLGVLRSSNIVYTGQEKNELIHAIGQLRIIAYRKTSTHKLLLGDSFHDWSPESIKRSIFDDLLSKGKLEPSYSPKYDLIVAAPPFALRIPNEFGDYYGRNAEHFLIEKALEDLTSNGALVAILPSSFLFKAGVDQKLRQRLIEEDLIDSVISFPSKVLQNTPTPVSIIFINKSKKERGYVRFVDTIDFSVIDENKETYIDYDAILDALKSDERDEFVKTFANSEIRTQEYNLISARYLQQPVQGVALGDIAEFVRSRRYHDISNCKYVRIRDLKEDKFNFILQTNEIEPEPFAKVVQRFQEPCLILATRWSTLKPTFFESSNGEDVYFSMDVVGLKINERKVDLAYLVNELHSDFVKDQLASYRQGTVIPAIKKDDLLKLKIRLPEYYNQGRFKESLNEQKAKVQGALEAVAEEKKKELLLFHKLYGLENEIVEQNTYLRHKLAGPASNVEGSFKNIKAILDDHVAPVFPQLFSIKLTQEHDLTLGDYLKIMEKDVARISASVSRHIKIESHVAKERLYPVDLVEFTQQYVGTHMRSGTVAYAIRFEYDKDSLVNPNGELQKVFINGNADLLNSLYNNLIENAIVHAFDRNDNNRIEVYLMKHDEVIQILFSNTGKPFPDNFTVEDFIRKGSTAGPNAGDGFGGFYINEIIQKFNGKFDIIDETGGEGIGSGLATSFEIDFPIFETEENEEV